MTAATAILNAVGGDLTDADIKALKARAITPEMAEAAGLRRVESYMGAEQVGRRNDGTYAGIVIPNVFPGEAYAREFRIRRDQPDLEIVAGKRKERAKYVTAPDSRNKLYFVPGTPSESLADATVPIVITEGEFKAIALNGVATCGTVDSGIRFLAIGVTGVWNWRGTIGRESGSDGTRRSVKGPIPDLDRVLWSGRNVAIAYDADVVVKEQVQAARRELRAELRDRGANVGFWEWDISTGKGIDDHIAIVGPEVAVSELARVDYSPHWRDLLIKDSRALPASLFANVVVALRSAPEFEGVLSFDEFKLCVTARRPTPWGTVGAWSDQDDRLTTEWMQRNGLRVKLEVVGQAVQTVAQERLFHPVRAYLGSLSWDRTPRLQQWLSAHLGADDTQYTRAIGERWMISAVARVFRAGCKSDCSLVIEGRQGAGKSRALKTLAGEWFTDELADLGSKDAAMQTAGVWIIELAELDSLSRPEAARIKAFMSRSTDRFRPPYGKRVIEAPRQCIFAGTTNSDAYLKDETGARRFWPIRCGRIDLDALARDRDQLWAEAVALYDAGARWWLDDPDVIDAAADEQRERFDADPWQQRIADWIAERDTVSVDDVLAQCIDKPLAQWNQADKNRVARSLKALGWERFQRWNATVDAREWRYRRTA